MYVIKVKSSKIIDFIIINKRNETTLENTDNSLHRNNLDNPQTKCLINAECFPALSKHIILINRSKVQQWASVNNTNEN